MNLTYIEENFSTPNNFKKLFLHNKKQKKEFQRYEFLGDRVIAIMIASEIHKRFYSFDEGKLAVFFSYLTSASTICKIAKKLRLDIFLKKKNFLNISENVLSDFLEAILGALFIDSGYAKTNSVVLKLWEDEITNNNNIERDAKTLIQEWTQEKKLGLPEYNLIKKIGPEHNPKFQVEIKIKEFKSIKGSGKSIQLAQMHAAKLFMNKHIKEN